MQYFFLFGLVLHFALFDIHLSVLLASCSTKLPPASDLPYFYLTTRTPTYFFNYTFAYYSIKSSKSLYPSPCGSPFTFIYHPSQLEGIPTPGCFCYSNSMLLLRWFLRKGALGLSEPIIWWRLSYVSSSSWLGLGWCLALSLFVTWEFCVGAYVHMEWSLIDCLCLQRGHVGSICPGDTYFCNIENPI